MRKFLWSVLRLLLCVIVWSIIVYVCIDGLLVIRWWWVLVVMATSYLGYLQGLEILDDLPAQESFNGAFFARMGMAVVVGVCISACILALLELLMILTSP